MWHHKSIVLATLGCILVSPTNSSAHLSVIRQQWESAGTVESSAHYGSSLAAGDFDGDGFEDLAGGAPDHDNGNGSSSTGSVVVNYGSTYGLTQVGAVELEFDKTDTNQAFGHALAAGDFDDDGFDDLVVGRPGLNLGSVDDAGAISIHVGTDDGVTISGYLLSQESAGEISGDDDNFGWAMTVGRFNDDAFDDLAVSAVGRYFESGTVIVFYGSPNGLTGVWSDVFNPSNLGLLVGPGDRFGEALAAAPLLGSAEDDLAIGTPYSDVSGTPDAGRVFVLLGSPNELSPIAPVTLTASHFGLAPASDGKFGSSLAAGNFLQVSPQHDLAIGEPGYSFDLILGSGRVLVAHLDTPLQGADQFVLLEQNDGSETPESGDGFGASLGAGDMDLDGDHELAVGSPGEDLMGDELEPNTGLVQIFTREQNDVLDLVEDLDPVDLNDFLRDELDCGRALTFGRYDWTNRANLTVGMPGARFRVWKNMGELGLSPRGQAGAVLIYAPWRQASRFQSRSALAADCSGTITYSLRPFDPVPLASTTKAMTVYLAAEAILNGDRDPSDTIVIPPWIPQCFLGSDADLLEGETMTLEDLMKLAIYVSAGDACYAIAALLTDEVDGWPVGCPQPPQDEVCDPTYPIVQPTFVDLMNAKALELGMNDTEFTNPHGSRSGSCLGGKRHHSTAYDMMLLSRAAMQNPLFADIVGQEDYDIDRPFTGGAWSGGYGYLKLLKWQTDDKAIGIKPGDSGYARNTGLASHLPPNAVLDPATATLFGSPSSFTTTNRLSRMLTFAAGECLGPGPGNILPPLDPPPPFPHVSQIGIPADDGEETGGIVPLLEPLIDEQIELAPWQSVDGTTDVEVTVGHVSARTLPPGGSADFGVAPFDGHEGIRIRNFGPRASYLLSMSHPPGSSETITLAQNEEYLLPPQTAVGSASFSMTLENLSSTESAGVLVEEIGYVSLVSLSSTSPPLSFSLTRSAAGEIDHEMLSWRVRGRDSGNGDTVAFAANSMGSPTSVEPGAPPLRTPGASIRNFPNPFNPRTTIEYELAQDGPVRLAVYDVRGRRVRLLDLAPHKAAGRHTVVWEGLDDAGRAVASGVYHYRLEHRSGVTSGRMALVR